MVFEIHELKAIEQRFFDQAATELGMRNEQTRALMPTKAEIDVHTQNLTNFVKQECMNYGFPEALVPIVRIATRDNNVVDLIFKWSIQTPSDLAQGRQPVSCPTRGQVAVMVDFLSHVDANMNSERQNRIDNFARIQSYLLSQHNRVIQLETDIHSVAEHLRSKSEMENEIEELKALTKALLKGADQCCRPPHNIVQPFMGIVVKHKDIIGKYNLQEE